MSASSEQCILILQRTHSSGLDMSVVVLPFLLRAEDLVELVGGTSVAGSETLTLLERRFGGVDSWSSEMAGLSTLRAGDARLLFRPAAALAGAGESAVGGTVDAAGVSVEICSGAAPVVAGWLVALRADERVLLLGGMSVNTDTSQ